MQERREGRIQQWPQHVLYTGGSAVSEQPPHMLSTSLRQDSKSDAALGFEEEGEDDEDDDMFGGPRF